MSETRWAVSQQLSAPERQVLSVNSINDEAVNRGTRPYHRGFSFRFTLFTFNRAPARSSLRVRRTSLASCLRNKRLPTVSECLKSVYTFGMIRNRIHHSM
jgi:hypothetical protein